MPTVLTIFTDGGSRGNPGPAALGVTVQNEGGQVVYEVGKTLGIATNNEAEYQAIQASLVWLLEYVAQNPVESVTWKLDSKLVVEQINRNWKIKEPRMMGFATNIWADLNKLPCAYKLLHIPREQNKRADALVNQALDEVANS